MRPSSRAVGRAMSEGSTGCVGVGAGMGGLLRRASIGKAGKVGETFGHGWLPSNGEEPGTAAGSRWLGERCGSVRRERPGGFSPGTGAGMRLRHLAVIALPRLSKAAHGQRVGMKAADRGTKDRQGTGLGRQAGPDKATNQMNRTFTWSRLPLVPKTQRIDCPSGRLVSRVTRSASLRMLGSAQSVGHESGG